MLKLVELVVNRSVPILEIARLFAYILPTFLEVTVPMALLLSVLLSFGRLSADSEIVALKTSGVSLYQMVIPVGAFTVLVTLLALLLAIYARPWGNSNLKASLYEIAKTRASAGLRERVFNDDFAGLVIYVEHVEPPGDRLEGILIADARDPNQRNTVLAKNGFLVSNEEAHSVTLRLLDGSIHTFLPGEKSYHKTDFTTYDVSLNLAVALARFSQREKDAQEMTLTELRKAIAERSAAGRPVNTELVELHRKFSSIRLPGLWTRRFRSEFNRRAVRSRSFSVSLALIFVYYLLLTAGEATAEKADFPRWSRCGYRMSCSPYWESASSSPRHGTA
jgi:lipopolysaccharide export system permease protein